LTTDPFCLLTICAVCNRQGEAIHTTTLSPAFAPDPARHQKRYFHIANSVPISPGSSNKRFRLWFA